MIKIDNNTRQTHNYFDPSTEAQIASISSPAHQGQAEEAFSKILDWKERTTVCKAIIDAANSRPAAPVKVPRIVRLLAPTAVVLTTMLIAMALGLAYGGSPLFPNYTFLFVAGGTLILTFLQQINALGLKRLKNELAFELGSIKWRFKKNWYNEISLSTTPDPKMGRLFLSAKPSKDVQHLELLEAQEKVHVHHILTLLEDWEHEPNWFNSPYSQQDLEERRTSRTEYPIPDHSYPSVAQLNAMADTIDATIQRGENIVVHCKAGQGRSAMAVAAYLIKHQGFSAEQAAQKILQHRPTSTIRKKLKEKNGSPGLEQYAQTIRSDEREFLQYQVNRLAGQDDPTRPSHPAFNYNPKLLENL